MTYFGYNLAFNPLKLIHALSRYHNYLFSSLSCVNLTFHHLAVGNFFTIIIFLLTDMQRQNTLQTAKIHIKNIFSCICDGVRAVYRFTVYIEYRVLVFDIQTKPDCRVSNKISNLDFGTFISGFHCPQKCIFPLKFRVNTHET